MNHQCKARQLETVRLDNESAELTLGSVNTATTLLYLPTAPSIDPQQPLDYRRLCELNGNHWRKILIILAKLQAPNLDWRHYRDQQLLQQHEAICFSQHLLSKENPQPLHIIAGKASWQRLGLTPQQFTPLDENHRLLQRDNIILTPYPDYRQFPNQLIEQLRPIIQAFRS
ncbi:hypothetical protein Q4488_12040 [Amphritea sp. 1_MG-2023]|uniref:DUF6942 family protein n=1 Tax=Amphritea sp. 1_MG-2023 TaxID=3062670 RepID=UPI0026E31AE1|nr:hypothetical protein [Amphritea sp. 1_MG-2023]MDO6564115.1 hypothetical protein [Amphritea sp. 1_MG-2023]